MTAKSKAKSKPATKVKATAPAKAEPQLSARPEHNEGSRKQRVHEMHDQDGVDAAWTYGQKIGLKQSTLTSWFAIWRRRAEQGAKPTKAAKVNSDTPPLKQADAVQVTA